MSAARQARRERRESERKTKKAETRRIKAAQLADLPLEEELSQAAAPIAGFVSQSEEPASSKRAAINRANAQHSTGPKSPSGKVASSRNSLKHGLASGTLLIPGEDPAAFDALLHDLLEEHQPAGTTEDLLVHEMAQSFWLAQRAIRLQSECFASERRPKTSISLPPLPNHARSRLPQSPEHAHQPTQEPHQAIQWLRFAKRPSRPARWLRFAN